MIGTKLEAFFPKETVAIGDVTLRVEGLTGAGFVSNVDFDVRSGEILGFFGLVGAGRSEIANMLFGITAPDRGQVALEGEELKIESPADAIRRGIVLFLRTVTAKAWCSLFHPRQRVASSLTISFRPAWKDLVLARGGDCARILEKDARRVVGNRTDCGDAFGRGINRRFFWRNGSSRSEAAHSG